MADIALTADQIALIDPKDAEVVDGIAAEAVTAGQAAYYDANGKFGIADANVVGKQQFRGIFLRKAAAGQAVSVLKKGRMYGFTVSGLAYDAKAFLSDTAGALADTASVTKTVNCGRVVPLSDQDRTKVLYIEADWLRDW